MASVAVYSPKGGVGKSTSAVNLAYLSASTSKRRTLLWDIDAQGAASFLLGVPPRHQEARRIFSKDADPVELAQPTSFARLSVITADTSLRRLDAQLIEEDARKRMRKLIRGLETRFERVIVDCPPGLTEISEQIFRAVDLIVIPVPPSALGRRAFDETVESIRGMRRDAPPILPVLSMTDRRRKLHREMVAAHPDWSVIPYASVVERMATERAPLAAFAPRHPAAQAFAELWSDVEHRLIESEAFVGQGYSRTA
jgi:cellulose biosynthesis protein BcsQ